MRGLLYNFLVPVRAGYVGLACEKSVKMVSTHSIFAMSLIFFSSQNHVEGGYTVFPE